MKKLFFIFLTIVFCANIFAQREKYSSKERDEYYKNYESNYVPFKPLDTEFIRGFKSEYFEIYEDTLNNNPYFANKYVTPYADSVFSIMWSEEYYMQKIEMEFEKIGKINKVQVLKYEKKDSIEAFIYYSSEYENIFFGETGIWIAYSENNGNDWNYYYTGIVQAQPVFVKYYSKRPLINEKGKLEIDACLLKQHSPFSHPVGNPNYECVKDNIYIVFNIKVIAKDSDNDGLTDIVEDKLYTNKYNKDTDGDGIPDNLDTNPRVNYPRTEKSKIYEAILNDDIEWIDKEGMGKLLFKEHTTYKVTDTTETVLIVTDNEDLMGINPKKYRVIFMTTDEYKKKTKVYETELNVMDFSPLFKVDKMKDTYIMTYHFNTWGNEYLIRKTKKGWIIQMLSSWIS